MASPFNKSNSFDLTHEVMATYEMGYLYPNMLMEVVPGDTFQDVTESTSRFEAMIAPQMSRIDKYQYFFYVPYRVLFADWEKYITGGLDGQDTTVKPFMVSPSGGYAIGSLADHLGVPTGVAGLKHSALPFRMYAKIMNDWFFDENLDTMFTENTSSGADATTNTTLQKKRWEKDYFTNSLPTPQRGGSSYLPLGTSAPTTINGNGALKLAGVASDGTVYNGVWLAGGEHTRQRDQVGSIGVTNATYSYRTLKDSTPIGVSQNQPYGNSGLVGVTDLTSATAVTVNQMRVAFQVQKFMEKNMRGGARLVEWTLSHFGVRIPDGRLQRSEYLSGSRYPVSIAPVEQTSSTDSTSPQGNLAGRGVEGVNTCGFRKSFVEQGLVMGLVCYLPRTMYCQGLQRLWSRETRYDEYIPVFAHLGEQEVKNKEIYAQGSSVVDSDGNVVDEQTFGYQDRFNEFRHIPSSVHGQLRPGGSLNYWSLARQFNSLPQLSSSFVESDPSNRIFAVTSGVDHITAHFLHHVKAIRPIPKFGNPGLIDHD